MSDLVEVKKNNIYCDSKIVADKFGKRHRDVILKIEELIKQYSEIKGRNSPCLNFIKTERNYRNQIYNVYLMDRKAFSMLTMRFTGQKALEWQDKFVDAFFDMEKLLIQTESNKNNDQWKIARQQGKEIRLLETDVIKNFVEYATKQGSVNAKFYYKHITNSTYKCLGLIQHKKPKLRESLDFIAICYLVSAESIAKKSLEKHMEEGEHYKVIFELVKQDLEKFSDSLILKIK